MREFSSVLLEGAVDPVPSPARNRLTVLANRHDDARAISRSQADKKQELIAERGRWLARTRPKLIATGPRLRR